MAETEQPIMVGARFAASNLAAPERIERAIKEIEANILKDPGVVFDHAKSLVETTCKTIFKEMGKEADENWNLGKLAGFTLNAVIRIPDGHPEPVEAKKRFETALKGLVSVAQGLGEIRNLEGELAHGKDAGRVSLTPSHAEFAARAADVVVKFLVESYRAMPATEETEPKIIYSQNKKFNEYIDDLYPPVSVFDAAFKMSEVLFQMDPQLYRDSCNDYQTKEERDPE